MQVDFEALVTGRIPNPSIAWRRPQISWLDGSEEAVYIMASCFIRSLVIKQHKTHKG